MTPSPFIAVWEITLRCDQACGHCGSRAGRPRQSELTTAEAIDLVAQLAELGVREVTLIGGEAYMRGDWLEILGAISRHGMLATLVTGGFGMTAAKARAAFAAGLKSASVSIDGTPATHDGLRGRPQSFLRAQTALQSLGLAGVATAVNTQINRRSVGELSQILDTVVEARAQSWQVQLTVPMGRAADDPELILQPYELIDLFPRLAALAAAARERGVQFVCGNNIGYFGPYDGTLRRGFAAGHAQACGAGSFTMGIEADGTVKGCPSLATAAWAGGNVRTASLRSIWEAAAPMRAIRERTSAELWGHCAACYYAPECRGGCTWMSDSVLGRPGNNPYCHHRALELKRQGRRERIEMKERAPGAAFDRARYVLIEEPDSPLGDACLAFEGARRATGPSA
jgi:radical SAM protein with 4Fe4S-binding SPASM domain